MSQEFVLPQGTVILSTSDLQGNIVRYNTGFKDASGYTDEELRGKPHSLLRHPDMPKEAFEDLWNTLKSGRAWFGIVKNKRKNGDYYWVSANAAPIKDGSQVKGYVSVRYPATREQIAFADALYKDIRSGRQAMPWTKAQTTHHQLWSVLAGVVAATPLVAWMTGVTAPLAMAGVATLALGGIGYFLYRSFGQSHFSDEVAKGIDNIANNRTFLPIQDRSELGFMLNYLRARVAENTAFTYDALREAQVLSTAVESTSSNIMIIDNDFNILNINKNLHSLFVKDEHKFRTLLPNFSADKIVGSNMSVFHKNPAHQEQMLRHLTGIFKAEIKVGGMVLALTIIPIERQGAKLGYVVEWLDRTIEATVVTELSEAFEGMMNGDFSKRITSEAEGIYEKIKQDVNNSMNVIQESLNSITTIVTAQAEGDLTKAFPAGRYLGQFHDLKNAMTHSNQKVKESVIQAVNASNVVSDAANQVSHGASDLSGRVQEQAASLEETSATMNEISAAVETNTANARKVSDLANQVQGQASEGAEVMAQTITAMQSIKEASSKIADIVSIIDGIAFQTNLLALNAAVEAARAGEHGRGFAVVAGEVRALAQKSADAAKDIKDLITDSVQRIEAGTQLADKSGEMLNGITDSIANVAAMVEQIAHASSEQTIGIQQVHKAISDIDRVTQENAALVEETTAASESLTVEAAHLKASMSFFKTGETPQRSSYQANPVRATKKSRVGLPAPSSAGKSNEWSDF